MLFWNTHGDRFCKDSMVHQGVIRAVNFHVLLKLSSLLSITLNKNSYFREEKGEGERRKTKKKAHTSIRSAVARSNICGRKAVLRFVVISGKPSNCLLASALRISARPSVLYRVMPNGTCVRISMVFGSSLTRSLAKSKDGRLK